MEAKDMLGNLVQALVSRIMLAKGFGVGVGLKGTGEAPRGAVPVLTLTLHSKLKCHLHIPGSLKLVCLCRPPMLGQDHLIYILLGLSMDPAISKI
mmetsp:Transcript_20046/g.35564  ORF Transcript_20046/g.35564 Transcript_20046/m.35564 type:complete len:95 (+) Transcript_20046:915-1199(+)